MNLRSKVDQLTRRVGRPAGGRFLPFAFVELEVGDGPAIVRDATGYATALRVPRSAAEDREAALSAEQLAAIRPGYRPIFIYMPADEGGGPCEAVEVE